MESNRANDNNVRRASEEMSLGEARKQEPSSPTGSLIEFDIGARGSIRKSSTQFDGHSQYSPPPSQEPPLSVSAESSPMKSPPPVQTMGHPPGYDPNRIPASVFAKSPGNASEWSATSNESLFSIQMGNNSFSRDYMFLFGKSDEVPRIDDWSYSPSHPLGSPGDIPRLKESSKSEPSNSPATLPEARSPEQGRISSPSPSPSPDEQSKPEKKDSSSPKIVIANHTREKSISDLAVDPPAASPKSPAVKTPAPAETTPPGPPTPPTPSTPTTFPSPPRFSNESGNSGSSFAFPV
ncbi:uncharacterized protein LOC127242136 [Andrographis paniculata]|uniref:uncharacterized protein LOC127242136 n=1 Tax=Andrographis paniculata TaxID=175694 RepID=UPI0021E87F91|nr:uncharacterized protein LOC127242136 [Andrographis paniculata]